MSKKKKKKKRKEDSGRCPETRQGQAPLDRLTEPRSVLPPKVENKKYNIRRIILCQKMEKDVQEIHIHSHR